LPSWEKKSRRTEEKTEPSESKTTASMRNASKLRVTSEDCSEKNQVSTKVSPESRTKTTNLMPASLS
jgi:hypothetical protein